MTLKIFVTEILSRRIKIKIPHEIHVKNSNVGLEIQARYKVWQQLNIWRMFYRKSLRFGKELRAFKFYSFQFFQFYTFICFRDTRLT
jgi:hypothetical protein